MQTAGGTGKDIAWRTAVDTANNCYLACWFQGTALIGCDIVTAQGGWDVFVTRLTQASLQFCRLSVSCSTVQMRLVGLAGANVVVDAFLDLATWTPWQTNMLPVSGTNLGAPTRTNRSQFFRAGISLP